MSQLLSPGIINLVSQHLSPGIVNEWSQHLSPGVVKKSIPTPELWDSKLRVRKLDSSDSTLIVLILES